MMSFSSRAAWGLRNPRRLLSKASPLAARFLREYNAVVVVLVATGKAVKAVATTGKTVGKAVKAVGNIRPVV